MYFGRKPPIFIILVVNESEPLPILEVSEIPIPQPIEIPVEFKPEKSWKFRATGKRNQFKPIGKIQNQVQSRSGQGLRIGQHR